MAKSENVRGVICIAVEVHKGNWGKTEKIGSKKQQSIYDSKLCYKTIENIVKKNSATPFKSLNKSH